MAWFGMNLALAWVGMALVLHVLVDDFRESWHGFGNSGTDSKLGWSPLVKGRSPAQDWWLASIRLVAHKPSNVCVSTGTCPIRMCSGRAYTIPVGV